MLKTQSQILIRLKKMFFGIFHLLLDRKNYGSSEKRQ